MENEEKKRFIESNTRKEQANVKPVRNEIPSTRPMPSPKPPKKKK